MNKKTPLLHQFPKKIAVFLCFDHCRLHILIFQRLKFLVFLTILPSSSTPQGSPIQMFTCHDHAWLRLDIFDFSRNHFSRSATHPKNVYNQNCGCNVMILHKVLDWGFLGVGKRVWAWQHSRNQIFFSCSHGSRAHTVGTKSHCSELHL